MCIVGEWTHLCASMCILVICEKRSSALSITQDAREQTHQRQEAGNFNAAPDRPHAATNQTMAKG